LSLPTHYLHVPEGEPTQPGGYPLLVVVHDSTSNAEACRDAFIPFADRNRCAVLAPLFPALPGGISVPAAPYKFLVTSQVRFDQMLLTTIAEVAADHHIDASRFLLHGFSGGGQFAHRFFYLHPDRLKAVSIASPGRITPLDFSRPWWAGVADTSRVFGTAIRLDEIRSVPVQVLVGSDDTGPTEPGNPGGIAGATGHDRVQRARFLQASLIGHGIPSEFEIVPGAAHNHAPLLPPVHRFLAERVNR
jgi:poly(3-hydroxybutyrate) depolymerase